MSNREDFIRSVLLNESLVILYSQPILADIEEQGKFKNVSSEVKTKKVLFATIDFLNDLYDKIEEVSNGGSIEG